MKFEIYVLKDTIIRFDEKKLKICRKFAESPFFKFICIDYSNL